MALVRYTPKSTFRIVAELDLFSNRLSRAFGNAWNTPEPTGAGSLPVNVEEAADELLLTAELPGMREEDVNVDIENNILTIRGEKRRRVRRETRHRYHVWERRYGSFQQAFTLPSSVRPMRFRRSRCRNPHCADAEGSRGERPYHRDRREEEVKRRRSKRK